MRRPSIVQCLTLVTISIHAPPRRSATHSTTPMKQSRTDFNPRTPAKECDLIRFNQLDPSTSYFNPRTPAKECDQGTFTSTPSGIHFNPRTPAKECDLVTKRILITDDLFQSTHPREGVRPQHIANRELHLLHIGCQTAEKPTVSVIFE